MGRNPLPIGLILAAGALLFGLAAATLAAWTTDDAYISFRYAKNLVEGHGLVFNPGGERVQGYTHPLWVLVIAAGLRVGVPAETWTQGLGIAAFGVALAALAAESRRSRRYDPMFLPIAALAGAAHRDWAIFATSGLETSWLTMFVTLGYIALRRDLERPSARGALPGMWLGLATVTRPDAGILGVVVGAVYLFARREGLGRYALAGLALVVPMLALNRGYYGDWLPNPYAAKSSEATWWSQGARYLQLYVEAYAPLLLGPVLVLGGRLVGGVPLRAHPERLFLIALVASVAAYGTAVVRVGGDFMFARLFIPVTPLLCLLLELGIASVARERILVRLGLTAGVVAALQLLPRPVSGIAWRYGVADEWEYYDSASQAFMLKDAAALRAATEGLPVRIAFMGAFAGVIYHADVPWATDAETGLTDRGFARTPIATRGRPGHEKHPSVEAMLERRIHFVLGNSAARVLKVARSIPVVSIEIGEITGVLLRWDPTVMSTLRQRGVQVADFERELDRIVEDLPKLDDGAVELTYTLLRRFYFDFVDDPERAAPFERRLAEIQRRP